MISKPIPTCVRHVPRPLHDFPEFPVPAPPQHHPNDMSLDPSWTLTTMIPPDPSPLFIPPSPFSLDEDEIDEPMLPISPPPLPPLSCAQLTRREESSPPRDTNKKPSVDVDLSVFDILNIFRRRWYLSQDHLTANTVSAQKAEDGKISWVEFTPHFHSHLVKCAVALVPRPVRKVKQVMFVFILELLNGEGDSAFFELQKGGRKANNAQKEKRRLAQKRSRAAKQEWDREAAKVANVPTRLRSCQGCGRNFMSRKTASRHKCPHSKVVREPVEAAEIKVSRPRRSARLGKPTATITPLAPIAGRLGPHTEDSCPRQLETRGTIRFGRPRT
jgi:hypothetical protein